MLKATTLMLALALFCAPAWAAEVTDPGIANQTANPAAGPAAGTPPGPAAPSAPAVTPPAASAGSSSPPAASASPSPADGTAPVGAVQTAPSLARSASTLIPSDVAPGPYETDRKKVRNWLLEAKKRGVGLTAYMPVWNDMEGAVRSGASDADVKTKLDGICRSIGNQVRDSRQVFRPVKPKPNPDEGVEIIRVRWIGEKGGDPSFRDKADKWYNNAVDMLPRESRSDPQIRRKLHDQRDQIYKEMSARWAAGEHSCGPRTYVNMNQDMKQSHDSVQFRNQNQELRQREEGTDAFENNSRKNF